MATKKTENSLEGYFACLIHCLLYSLPFLLITSFNAWLVIFLTHYVIDKFRLAKYVCQLKEWNFKGIGYHETTPIWLSTWLLFIVDNTLHVTINYLAINYI